MVKEWDSIARIVRIYDGQRWLERRRISRPNGPEWKDWLGKCHHQIRTSCNDASAPANREREPLRCLLEIPTQNDFRLRQQP